MSTQQSKQRTEKFSSLSLSLSLLSSMEKSMTDKDGRLKVLDGNVAKC